MKRAKDKSAIQKFVLYIPQDAVVATGLDKSAKTRIVDWDAHVVADIENYPKRVPRSESVVADDEMILDIGPFSGAFIAGAIQLSGTVIWNGALGVTEVKGLQGPIGPFAHGTQLLVDALLGDFGNKPYSLLGGGDTVGYTCRERRL
jgi:3-phosphoglycerate kinase